MLSIIVITLLAGAALGLLVRLFCLHRAMDSMARELKEMNQEEPVCRHLQIPVPDSHLELLAEEINSYLTQSFSRSSEQKKREQNMRLEITNISHDLRTPLTSILGYLELIEEGPLTREQSDYLNIIQKRSRHLNMLISQLYEYARLETQTLPLETETVDLAGLLREHLLSFYQEFQDKGMELKPLLPENPVQIKGDRNALERVLHNLTSNMLRYGDGSASVTLSLEKGRAVLRYANYSPELTKASVSHIFDPFYTAEQARTSQMSGLGITVAKLLAEQMGGSMQAGLKEQELEITCSFPLLPC